MSIRTSGVGAEKRIEFWDQYGVKKYDFLPTEMTTPGVVTFEFEKLLLTDTDASPLGNVLLKVLKEKLKLRNAADLADVVLEEGFIPHILAIALTLGGGGTLGANLAAGGNKITGLGAPVDVNDAARKADLGTLDPVGVYEYGGFGWFSAWDSLDGIAQEKSAEASIALATTFGRVDLKTGAVLNNYAMITKYMLRAAGDNASWDKKRRLKVKIHFESYINEEAFVIMGSMTANQRKAGFKLDGSTLYGIVGNGTADTLTAAIETLPYYSEERLLEVVLDPTECRFFVDGVDKGALTSGLPTGTTDADRIMVFYLKTLEEADKDIRAYEARFVQEP